MTNAMKLAMQVWLKCERESMFILFVLFYLQRFNNILIIRNITKFGIKCHSVLERFFLRKRKTGIKC